MRTIFHANASGVNTPNVERKLRFSNRRVKYPRLIPGKVLCACGEKPGCTIVDADTGFELPVCPMCLLNVPRNL